MKVYLTVYNQEGCKIEQFDIGTCDEDNEDEDNYTDAIIKALKKSDMVLFKGDTMKIETDYDS